ncbi:ion transporter [Altererythrobacter sp. ZODW24]|uniref:ion transporter n=1 Tax=Altererythrobacter sp. ZODW24 TaxID=2185142 RepID=UPI000DF7D5E4|nr:ion transporter [Altererythrobacter sp. ZODW24]
MREKLQKFIESSRFEGFITIVIVVNAIALGLETVPSVVADYGKWLSWADEAAITIFVIEIGLKLFVYRHRFFASGWNVFDLLIVSVALVPASQQFSVLRALRILRILRLVSVVPSMRQVVQGLLGAIPSMGTVIALLSLIFYIGAVMATKLFGQEFPHWFGTIGESLYSLFQIMTLESWSMGIVRPLMEVYPYAWAFFVPFILVTSFIVLNLFIAIIVTAMDEANNEEAEHDREEILAEIRALRVEVGELKK